jgi:polyhydroxyalkanoate synthesis regulator phasin
MTGTIKWLNTFTSSTSTKETTMKEIFEQLGLYAAHGDQEVAATAARAQELTQYLQTGEISVEEYQSLLQDMALLEDIARDSEAAQQRQAMNYILGQLISGASAIV